MICGALGALKQRNIKRFVAYASINQLGFILLGFSCGSYLGFSSALFNLFIYVITSLLFFLLLSSIFFYSNSITRELEFMQQLKMLTFKSNRLIIVGFVILFFSMSGLPPFIGFFGKYLIILSLIESGFIKITFFVIFINVISTFYYVRVIKNLWFDYEFSIINHFLDKDNIQYKLKTSNIMQFIPVNIDIIFFYLFLLIIFSCIPSSTFFSSFELFTYNY